MLELAVLPLPLALIPVLFLAALQLFPLKVAEGAALEQMKLLLEVVLEVAVVVKAGLVVLVNFPVLEHRAKEILVAVTGHNQALGHAAAVVEQELLV